MLVRGGGKQCHCRRLSLPAALLPLRGAFFCVLVPAAPAAPFGPSGLRVPAVPSNRLGGDFCGVFLARTVDT